MIIKPRNIRIIGYENNIFLEILISIMIGMVEGDVIPPVKLSHDGQDYYIPFPGCDKLLGADGGHHRTLAAYLLGVNLNTEIVDYEIQTPYYRKIFISLIEIKSNPETFHFERDIIGKFYRDLPTINDFFSRYQKINYALKYGTHADYSLDQQSYKQLIL